MTAYKDPVWFWRADFTDGHAVMFFADSKVLAADHAALLAPAGATVKTVTRISHAKDVSAATLEHAGKVYWTGTVRWTNYR